MVDLVFLLIPLNIAELYCHARAPPLRFLHQLRFLPNKEMEFTGNEASKLHLSGISFLFFSCFTHNSAAFHRVPVRQDWKLGFTRATGDSVQSAGFRLKNFCQL